MSINPIEHNLQKFANWAADKASDPQIWAMGNLEYNPASATWHKGKDSVKYTTRLVVAGDLTYVGKATIGTATSAASWQVQRIDEASGTIILWADGNANFDNVWDNYDSLDYS